MTVIPETRRALYQYYFYHGFELAAFEERHIRMANKIGKPNKIKSVETAKSKVLYIKAIIG
jgi:hypothetical protein